MYFVLPPMEQAILPDWEPLELAASKGREAGIVIDEKRGTRVFYRLRVPCILNFFGCVEAVLEDLDRYPLVVSK